MYPSIIMVNISRTVRLAGHVARMEIL